MTHAHAAALPEASFWDNIAEKYSRQPVADPVAFDRKTAITLKHLGSGSRVLDVGCGTGSFALRLAPTGAEVHGLDFSSEMIRIAREKAHTFGAGNVTFHVGALDDTTGFEPSSFDVVCAYSLLHLVADRRAALALLFQLLKPGGVFISSNVCLGESWVPYRPILKLMHTLGKAPPVGVYSKRDVAREFSEAGFVEIETPDVGAERVVHFVVAKKPHPSQGPLV